MIRLAANLKWLFTEQPLLERFDAAVRAGFTAVECSSPYENKPADLARRVADTGLTVVLINTPIGTPGSGGSSGYACLPERRNEFRDGILRALHYASALGCEQIHLMAGIRPVGLSHDAAEATYLENLGWAVGQAAPAGKRFVIEAINQRDVPAFFLRTQEQAAATVTTLNTPTVRMLFDCYHCQVEQGDLTRRLAENMPLIGHVQIADAPRRSEPGTGEIAWPYVFDQLGVLGYAGWIGCEYRPLASTESGLSWRHAFAPGHDPSRIAIA
jgi:hydroxypyruvate isomerase